MGSAIQSAKGMAKAAVLPEPVRDCTRMSRRCRTSGMAVTCTSMGSVKPMSESACRTADPSPRSAKVVLGVESAGTGAGSVESEGVVVSSVMGLLLLASWPWPGPRRSARRAC